MILAYNSNYMHLKLINASFIFSAPLSAVVLLLHSLTAKCLPSGERWEYLSQEHSDPFTEMWCWWFLLPHPSLYQGHLYVLAKYPPPCSSYDCLGPKLLYTVSFTCSSFSLLTLKLLPSSQGCIHHKEMGFMALVPPTSPPACNFRASTSGHPMPALPLCAALHLHSKPVHPPWNNCMCCCLLVSYTLMCLCKTVAVSLNRSSETVAHFWEWLLPAEQTQPSPAGHTQQSRAAPELWAELSKELLLHSEQRQHQIYRLPRLHSKGKMGVSCSFIPCKHITD